MQNGWRRFLCVCLCLVLLLPLAATCGGLSALAAPADEKRFIFSTLCIGEDISYDAAAGEPISLALSETAHTFTAKGIATVGGNDSNALYVALSNGSNATSLEITYGYSYDQTTLYETVSEDLTAESHSFVLLAPYISQGITELTLTFKSEDALSGEVRLESFYDVSVYTGEAQEDAVLQTCRYDSETQRIEIGGELSYAASSRYADARLELFVLEPGEELYLPNKMPVASMDISLTFSFSVNVAYVENLYSRYVVAAVKKSGERIPLCVPVYPDIPVTAALQEVGFKGFHSNLTSLATDSGIGVEIVDVYLDRLQGERSTGILYTGAHSYYYFDETYVQSLDDRIRELSAIGCDVYLRFLISPTASANLQDVKDYPYVTDAVEGIVNKGIAINSQSDLLTVNAFTDFLTKRYEEKFKGSVCGIILGRKADRALTHNYVGPMSLSDYAEQYATALNLVAGAARRNIPDARIVVPLSDRMWTETVSVEKLNGDYFSELFLLSLLEVLKTRTLTPAAFSVMLESETVPDLITEGEKNTYGTDRISAFLAMIAQYRAYYGFLDAAVTYSFTPSAELSDRELRAAYILQYVDLFANDHVRSFLLDTSLLSDEEAVRVYESLRYLIAGIDTAGCEQLILPVLQAVGIPSVDSAFPNFDIAKLQTRKVLRSELSQTGYHDGKIPLGSHPLWDFSVSTDVLNWYRGNACRQLSVLGRALNAEQQATSGGEYAEIAYRFSAPVDYSFAPLMRFRIGINGTADTPYEVLVRLVGDGVDITSSVVLTAGKEADLYLDLSAYVEDLRSLRSIRLQSRALNGDTEVYTLRLYDVYLESAELSDAELEEKLAAKVGDAEKEQNTVGERDYTTPILITALILAASASVIAVLAIVHYNQKRKRTFEKEKQ